MGKFKYIFPSCCVFVFKARFLEIIAFTNLRQSCVMLLIRCSFWFHLAMVESFLPTRLWLLEQLVPFLWLAY